MGTLRFWWYINKQKQSHVVFCYDISTKPTHTHIDCFVVCWYIIKSATLLCVFVDISSSTQSVHLQCCWYIIKDAKCQLRYCQTKVDTSSTKQLTTLRLYQQPFDEPTNKKASTQLGFVLISINAASCCLDVWQTKKLGHWICIR